MTEMQKLWRTIAHVHDNPRNCRCCIAKMLATALDVVIPELSPGEREELQPRLAALPDHPKRLNA